MKKGNKDEGVVFPCHTHCTMRLTLERVVGNSKTYWEDKEMRLNKDKIDELFETENHQANVMVGLYKMVFPNWDEIKSVDDWPKIGKQGAYYLAEKFMAFDRKHHPNVMPGGIWLNNGFSSDETLEDFEVVRCKVTLK